MRAIGKEAAGIFGQEEEDRDSRQGVELVYWADPGRLSILAKGLKFFCFLVLDLLWEGRKTLGGIVWQCSVSSSWTAGKNHVSF